MEIEKSYDLPFPVDRVFGAWTSPDTVIAPADRMVVEAIPGGRYELYMDHPGGGSSNKGRFHSVEANERVVYTWEWNGDGEVTVIDVRFSQTPDGTRIVLSHRGFQAQTSRDMHDSGWDSYVAGLRALLEQSA